MNLQVIRRGVPIKGWNTVAPLRAMEPDFSPILENCWFESGIKLKRRPAIVQLVTPTVAGAAQRVLEHEGSIIRTYLTVPGATMDVREYNVQSFISRTTFATPTAVLRNATLKGTSIWGNGVDTPQYSLDGITFSPVVNLPTLSTTLGNMFITYKGRCWAAGDPANPMTIFISDAMTSKGVQYWKEAPAGPNGELGVVLDCQADLARPDIIMGLTVHRDFLVVFFTNQILFYTVTDPAAAGGIKFYKRIEGEGCVSHDSIKHVGEDVIFLSYTGFKSLNVSLVQGDSQVNDISQPINNTVKEELRKPTFNKNNITAAYNPKFGLYICNINGIYYAWQLQFNAWFRWIVPLDGALHVSNALDTLIAGTSIYKFDETVYQDYNNTPVNMRWRPAPFRAQTVETKNRWNKFEVLYEAPGADTLTIKTFLDNNNTPLQTYSATLTPTVDLGNGLFQGRLEMPIIGRSELLNVELSNNSNSNFNIVLCEAYFNVGNIR